MQPTNQKERNILLVYFSIFFLLAVGVVTLAVFYDFEVPEKENEVLRKIRAKNDLENKSQQAMMNQVIAIDTILDKAELSSEISRAEIILQVNKLKQSADTLPQTQKAFYQSIVNSYSKVIESGKKLSETDSKIAQAQKDAERFREELKNKNQELSDCRRGF